MSNAPLSYLFNRRETDLSESLLSAYEETHYRVFHQPPFTLEVGIRSEAAAGLHQRHGVNTSVFLTAYNPYSQPLSDDENRLRQAELENTLASEGWVTIRGAGCHPSNYWPSEHSVLILGMSIDQARALARRFDQNAFLFVDTLATPELVLLV